MVASRPTASPPSGTAGASTRSTADIGAVGSRAGWGTRSTPGAAASTMRQRRALGPSRDDGETVRGGRVLHRHLAARDGEGATEPLATHRGAPCLGRRRPARPGSSTASATASSPRSAAAAKRTAALPRYGTGARCAPSARAIRHSSTAPSPSSPPTDSAPNSTRPAHGSASRASSVSTDSLSHRCSSLSSRSISRYSCGRARTRSAMMLRWICCVPPYTLAAREYRYVSSQNSSSSTASASIERRAEHLERGRRQPLLGLGHQQLDARAVGTDGAAVEELPDGAVRVVAQDLDADQRPREGDLGAGILDQRLAVDACARPPRGRRGRATCAA